MSQKVFQFSNPQLKGMQRTMNQTNAELSIWKKIQIMQQINHEAGNY